MNEKSKKIEIEKVDEKDYKPDYWAAFRQPNNIDKKLIDDPWMKPWVRKPGWRNLLSKLWFGEDVNQIPVDLKEYNNSYQVTAKIPDVSSDKIDIQLTSKTLAIVCNEETDESKNRSYIRSVEFANEVVPEKSEAFLEDGELIIKLKKEKVTMEQAGQKIKVNKKEDKNVKDKHRSN